MRRIAWVLLVWMSACGGGGADPEPVPLDTALFEGTFHAFFLKGYDNSGQRFVTSAWGTVTANGAGVITTNLRENQDGFLTGPVPLTLLTYEVDLDRSMRWYFPAVDSAVSWQGAVSIDGDMAVLSSVREGSDPEIIILFRPGVGLDNDALHGTYHTTNFLAFPESFPGPARVISLVGATRYDDVEPWEEFLSHTNADGFVAEATDSFHGSYAVEPDGTATHTTLPLRVESGTWEGAAGAGGALLVLGGGVPALDPDRVLAPQLELRVRRQDPLTAIAQLEGEYWVVGFSYGSNLRQFRSVLGRLVADGAGGGSMTYTANDNRVPRSGRVDNVRYAVGPDGQLDMRLDGSCEGDVPCMRGGVASGGAFAMLGGGIVAGADPAIYFLMRR